MKSCSVAFKKAGVGFSEESSDTAGFRPSVYLFVYGTLKKGGPLHGELSREAFITTDNTYPHFTMLDLGQFPGVISKGTTAIHGEIYRVDKDFLELMDMIEGVAQGFYMRTRIPTTKYEEVYMYQLTPSAAVANKKFARRWEIIESGVWTNGRRE